MNIEVVTNRIYEIRGHRVMLDYDIAAMFEVETKRLNEAVKRNIERFPEDFRFQLTEKEWVTMRSQIATTSEDDLRIISSNPLKSDTLDNGNWSQFATSSKKHRGKTYLPFAFTEHGVTMLASVLRSEKAVWKFQNQKFEIPKSNSKANIFKSSNSQIFKLTNFQFLKSSN